jgi:hypothetical protein
VHKFTREVERRDDSFDYYSLLVRSEAQDSMTYSWYIIPKDHHIFNISKYEWKEKKRKNCRDVLGWTSKYMDITFSMSSQLWIHFNVDEIKQYLITSVVVLKGHKLSFSEIYRIGSQIL